MNNSNYKPYKAMEFHLNESIELHDHQDKIKMKKSEASYEAAKLAQQIQMDDVHEGMIDAYKAFCQDQGLKAQL